MKFIVLSTLLGKVCHRGSLPVKTNSIILHIHCMGRVCPPLRSPLFSVHQEGDSKVIMQREQPLSEYTLTGVTCSKSGLLGQPRRKQERRKHRKQQSDENFIALLFIPSLLEMVRVRLYFTTLRPFTIYRPFIG